MMLIKNSIIVFSSLILVSCGNNSSINSKGSISKKDTISITDDKCTTFLLEAKKFDEIISKATALNYDVAEKSIKVFYDFATNCKLDPLAPEFLLKAGQIAQNIHKYTQAQTFYQKCIDDFPKYKDRGAAMFLLGQLYDNSTMLNNEEEATTIYHTLIREYPKSSYASDAKACIKNIGKTDDQLIEEFLKKNK
jgi:TolA-binding protein